MLDQFLPKKKVIQFFPKRKEKSSAIHSKDFVKKVHQSGQILRNLFL